MQISKLTVIICVYTNGAAQLLKHTPREFAMTTTILGCYTRAIIIGVEVFLQFILLEYIIFVQSRTNVYITHVQQGPDFNAKCIFFGQYFPSTKFVSRSCRYCKSGILFFDVFSFLEHFLTISDHLNSFNAYILPIIRLKFIFTL